MEPVLGAMAQADLRFIKLEYFKYDPETQDYREQVDSVRKAFEGWEKLGERCGVKVCYHTHSQRNMGLNASMPTHLILGFDPRYIGAYLDTGHTAYEREEFAVGAAILKD